jgi:photosystem II PsbT protein
VFLTLLKIKQDQIMEALVYTFLLIGTLMVIFFAVFFRDTPRILKK